MAAHGINDDRVVAMGNNVQVKVEKLQTNSFADKPTNNKGSQYDQQAVFCVIAENGHLGLLMTADTIPSGAVPTMGYLMHA